MVGVHGGSIWHTEIGRRFAAFLCLSGQRRSASKGMLFGKASGSRFSSCISALEGQILDRPGTAVRQFEPCVEGDVSLRMKA